MEAKVEKLFGLSAGFGIIFERLKTTASNISIDILCSIVFVYFNWLYTAGLQAFYSRFRWDVSNERLELVKGL
ncbi:hypothetical protein [Robiginitalea aurantiaca]|uniref:Uncharacterized protein n=1 Tax=Robiginitalea aurantiaca TaxID=3056915 RepID=A0ABT7WAD6_9FLAO|nr:hypothetical protein [Robiginitalea aurantiaca]MDM9629879.1 hypothetical protein [Robiginitalea aurantiaca]